jgi:hypothetical protein
MAAILFCRLPLDPLKAGTLGMFLGFLFGTLFS